MPNVTMPNGDVVAFPDSMPKAEIRSLIEKKFPNAPRQAKADTGVDPYDNPLELAGKVAKNLGPSIARSTQISGVGLAEAAKDIVTPDTGLSAMAAGPFDAIGRGIGALANLTGLDKPVVEMADKSIEELSKARALEDLKLALNAPDVAAGSAEELAYNVMFGAADMAVPMTASVLLRNPAPMAAYGALRSGSDGYQKAREAGLAPDQARAAAGMYAAAEAATEWVGTKLLLDGGKTLLGSALRGALSEGATEAATEALQALVDAGVIREDMTLEEVGERVKMAGAVGGILGAPFGAVGHLTRPNEQQAEAVAISEDVLGAEPVVSVEDTLALPAPETMLALPAPVEPTPIIRRQGPAPKQPEPPTEEALDYQAQTALRKTRQAETAALLQTARETIAPLGAFDRSELPGAAVERVATWRARTGKNIDAPITVEDMARAKVSPALINEAIAAKRPMTAGKALTPADVRAAADAKNIVHDDLNFKELAFRTTGSRDIDRMTQTQLNALRSTLDTMPAHDSKVTVPIAEAPLFDEGQYNKALDAIRNQGRFTLGAIKEATGLKSDKDAQAIRDAMVRRGQLVQRSENDFRLYDVLGEERQAVPDDLPKGAFSEYVVKRTPVNRIQIKVNGKSIGTFGSGSEARSRIRDLRTKEAEKGGPQAKIEITQVDEPAYAVMENRYDEQGNLLGQVAVDTSRDETTARKLAQQRNKPEAAPQFEVVTPSGETTTAPRVERARKAPPPEALRGRTEEVLAGLNKLARERALPLLGTKVVVKDAVRTPDGEVAQGAYIRNVISLTASTLEPGLTTDQVVDRLANVMDHELIHALKKAGVLGPETPAWKTLSRYVNKAKQPGTNETYYQYASRRYNGMPGYNTREDFEEEAIAEAFRVWAANKRNVVGQPATAFRQLVEWFKRLFQSIPEDVFSAIETGAMVREALTPKGADQPRAVAAEEMAQARRDVVVAQQAKDENAVRVASRSFLRARDQAREDRYGRSGPKTVLGTTPSKAFAAAAPAPREVVDSFVDAYRKNAGISTPGFATYLPEDVTYMARIADAQQRAVHDPGANDVAKAYRALNTETRSMFDALGITEVERWTEDGQPYTSPEAMLADIAEGRIKLRISTDMFGEGADNPGHPLYKASGLKTVDGTSLTFNDLFRVVHDVYGRMPIGLKRDSGRDDYNAYHEHARLLSPEARRALATETLAQSAWHHYGPHLRRRDGTVPRERDVDYLPPDRKEFAQQKAFLLPDELIAADPGWALAEKADVAARDAEAIAEAELEDPKFSLPDPLKSLRAYGAGRDPGTSSYLDLVDTAAGKKLLDALALARTADEAHRVADSWVLTQGRQWGSEYLAMFDSDGGLMAMGAGGKSNVGIPRYLDRAIDQGVARYATHNHPSDSGLSNADVLTALIGRNDAAPFTVRALGHGGTDAAATSGPLLEQRKKTFDADDAVSAMLTDVEFSLRQNMVKLVRSGQVPESLAQQTFSHVRNMVLRDLGIINLQSNRLDLVTSNPLLVELAAQTEKDVSDAVRRAGYKLTPRGDNGGNRSFEEREHRFFTGSRNDRVPRALPPASRSGTGFNEAGRYEQLGVAEQLPGGRLYGNSERSPGGVISAPDTPSPAFTAERDGNRFFGGEFADVQLQMVREGTDGATMLYLSPDEFLALADAAPNPEQAVYDALVNDGYKFNTMPSLVIDGYAGKVRAVASDGAYAAVALGDRAERIPVVLYPKRKENLGLVSAIDGKGVSVPWPADGRAENYLDLRGEEPRYSLTAQYGDRVPRDPYNMVDQRVEGWVGKKLAAIGRSKKDLPFVGSIFDLRVKFQDRMLSVKEMIEQVQQMGGKVTDETDVYMVEQLAGSRTVQEVEQREDVLYEPLFKALQDASQGKAKVSTKNLEDYLYARHAPERNAFLRASGSKVANPSGMSDSEAATILDGFALDGKLAELERLAGLVDAIVADTTKTRVAAGLISQETADQSPYEYYVPLRGKTEEDLDPNDVYDRPMRARSGKGYTVGGKEDRSAVGRERKAGDIIANVMLQNTESVIRAEKNRVAMSFMRLLQANPNTGFGTILSKAPTRMVRGANGMIRESGDPSFRQQPDIFTAKWKGKEIIARVEDPRVARAMRADYVQVGGEPSILDRFVAASSRMNRYLATINTSWNPEFLISNLARDMQTAGILGAQYDIKGLSGRIIKDAPAAMLAIREVLRDGTASTPLAQRFQEMQRAGGTTEFLGIHDLDTHVKRLRADAARTGWQPTARQAFNRIQTIGKFIDDYNKVAENAFRLGAYNAARDAGVSVDRAAFLAKNLTVNFNKGGENKAVMNSLYLFYNASISGTFVLLNGLKNKRVQRLVGGIVVAGMLQDLLNRALSGDEDDNGVKDYDDIPDYVLETNWVFMMPGSKDYIAIPMPYGFNFFHNLGRNMSNAFSGSPKHSVGKSITSTLMTAINAFNPIGGSQSPLNFIAPTFADPLVDLATNKDFAGNDIVPERPTFGLEVPDSQKYWSNTGDVPKWTAEQLNRLTGGNEVRSGAIDVSPEVLQYWLDYATGATGKFVQRNWQLGANISAGDFEDVKIGDIPFARRVVGSVTNRGNIERYYESATEIKTVDEELKIAQERNDFAAFDAIMRDKSAEAGLIDVFEKGEKEISAMRKQLREIKADENIPHAAKRQMIRDLEAQQDQLMAMLNKTYFQAKGFAQP